LGTAVAAAQHRATLGAFKKLITDADEDILFSDGCSNCVKPGPSSSNQTAIALVFQRCKTHVRSFGEEGGNCKKQAKPQLVHRNPGWAGLWPPPRPSPSSPPPIAVPEQR